MFYRLFTRITSRSRRYVPLVDGLRFVALALVVPYHLLNVLAFRGGVPAEGSFWDMPSIRHDPTYWLFGNGVAGVWIFFAISGFVLALPFAESCRHGTPRVTLRRYYLRRVLRIEPPYIVCMAVLAMSLIIVRHAEVKDTARHLLASLCYLHVPIYGYPNPANRVTWSLEVEVQFYLIAPLLACIYYVRRRLLRRMAFATVWAGSLALQLTSNLHWVAGVVILGQIGFFLPGLLIADVWTDEWNGALPERQTYCWDAAGLASLLLFYRPIHELSTSVIAFLPAAVGGFVYCTFRGRCARWLLESRPLTVVGGMCYTIYLYHMTLFTAAVQMPLSVFSGTIPMWQRLSVSSVLIGPPVFLACSALFLLCEKPFMYHDWPRIAFRAVSQGKRKAGEGLARIAGRGR